MKQINKHISFQKFCDLIWEEWVFKYRWYIVDTFPNWNSDWKCTACVKNDTIIKMDKQYVIWKYINKLNKLWEK